MEILDVVKEGGALILLAITLLSLGKVVFPMAQGMLASLGRLELSLAKLVEIHQHNTARLEEQRQNIEALRIALRLISESKSNGSTPESIRRGYEAAATVLKREEK